MRFVSLILASISLIAAADRVSLSGTVRSASGAPLEHAAVLIYHAGVKTGYSVLCPSCYPECGKKVFTNSDGTFQIDGLNSQLWFELLVLSDGYQATLVKKVDPSKGLASAVALSPRAPVADPKRVVRGRVVDAAGQPVRDAMVEPLGIHAPMNGSTEPMSMYGTIDGLEPLAVTDSKGEFELAHATPAAGMLLNIEARGMAPKEFALETGADRKTIAISEGAAVRGRLLEHGKPVGGVQVALTGSPRGGWGGNLTIIGNPFHGIQVGTQEDGTFYITNVPPGLDWNLHGKMDSLVSRGAITPIPCSTKKDGETTDLGDIELVPGYTLRGKIVLADGAPIRAGMHVLLGADAVFDKQEAQIAPDGSFEFKALPAGSYTIYPAVRGYALDQGEAWQSTGLTITKNIENYRIAMRRAGL